MDFESGGRLPEAERAEQNARANNLCSWCLALMALFLLLSNFDNVFSPPAEDNKNDNPSGARSDEALRERQPDLMFGVVPPERLPSYSLTFTGHYIVNLTSGDKGNGEKWQTVGEAGKAHIELLTKRSALRSVRLSNAKVILEPPGRHSEVLFFTGLDLKDSKRLAMRGSVPYSVFFRPSMGFLQTPPSSKLCSLSLTLRLAKHPIASVSLRPLGPGEEFPGVDARGNPPWRRRLQSGLGHLGANLGQSLSFESSSETARVRVLEAVDGPKMSQLDEVLSEGPAGVLGNVAQDLDFGSSGNLMSTHRDLEGEMTSADCGLWASVFGNEVDIQALGSRVVRFAVIYVAKNIVEIRSFMKQIKYTEAGSSVAKVSVVGIGMQSFIDIWECFQMISAGFHSGFMLPTFIVISTFKPITVLILHIRYVATIMRTRYADVSQQEYRHMMSRVVKGYLLIVLAGIFAIARVIEFSPGVVVMLYLMWIPQILWDIWKGHRRALCRRYVWTTTVCRAFIPFYFWGCPNNLFQGGILPRIVGAPSYSICLCIALLMVVQVVVMLGQEKWGSRFFVPLKFLPHVYDYHRPLTAAKLAAAAAGETAEKGGATQEDQGLLDCVICMGDVNVNARETVVTPCDHVFHEKCLQQWMDVKLECPTCRATLPSFP